MWLIIAKLFEYIKFEKKIVDLSTTSWTLLTILEIAQYAIFTNLVAIDDNEIFHIEGKEFLSITGITYLYRFLSRKQRNTIIIYILCIYTYILELSVL